MTKSLFDGKIKEDGNYVNRKENTGEDFEKVFLIAAGIGDVKEAERKTFVYSKEIALLDKELKEAQHRAEAAEMALRKFCNEKASACPLVTEWEIKKMKIYEEAIAQAEKELAEERKDDQNI